MAAESREGAPVPDLGGECKIASIMSEHLVQKKIEPFMHTVTETF